MEKNLTNSFLLGALLLAGGVNAQIDIATINAAMADIPYMFEGRVESVEVFAAYNDGTKVPNSAATWSDKYGTFGEGVYGYSDAKITICRVYKDGTGILGGGSTLRVLTRSFQLGGLYLEAVTINGRPDTLTRYLFTPEQYDNLDEHRMLLPPSDGKTYSKVFLATKIENIDLSNYAGQNHYSNFKTYAEVPLNVAVDIQQPDGRSVRSQAYASIIPYVFENEEQLMTFLSFITGVTPEPTYHCDSAVLISGLKENSKSDFVKVFPNPTTGSAKITVDKPSTLTVLDVTGRVILTREIQNEYSLNVADGMYILQFKSADSFYTTKLIKE